MKRDPIGKLFLVALVLVAATLVTVTRAPDAWWVEKLTRAAVFGPWIERLASLYRPPDRLADEVSSDLEGGVEFIYRIDPRSSQVRPTILVAERTGLYSEASEASERLAFVAAGARVDLFDRRLDWYEVGAEGRRGWIHLPDRPADQTVAPPLGSEPAAPLPVPSRPPDPEVLAAAVALLEDPGEAKTLGPYALHTDVRDRGLVIFLSALAAQVESAYRSRYELEPLPGRKEAVVLFASKKDHVAFLAETPEIAERSAPGMLRSGVIALYAEGRAWSEVGATLIHELTHLFNKRALGPALPPWLEEGIADDLAQSRIEGLRLYPGTLGGSTVRAGSRIEYKGGQAAVLELSRALDDGVLPDLETLLDFDWDEFQDSKSTSLRYGQSSFFVRSLLDSPEPGLAAAFRGFLRDVSKGRPATPEALRERLDRSWRELDSQFAAFVERQAEGLDRPGSRTSGSSSRQASEPSS